MRKIKIVLFGSTSLALRVLKDLLSRDEVEIVGVVSEPWTTASFSRNVEQGVYEYAIRNQIPLLTVEEIEQTQLEPLDLAFTVRFPSILSKRLINKFELGVVNFHGGPLPELRGVNSSNFAVFKGKFVSGGTLHYLDETIDTGAIIKCVRFNFDSKASAFDVSQLTQEALWEAYDSVISDLLSGKNIAIQNQTELRLSGTESEYIKKSDIQKIQNFDLGENAELLQRHVLASDFPGQRPATIEGAAQNLYVTTQPRFMSIWENNESRRRFDLSPDTSLDTPFHKLEKISDHLGADIWVKRDDLFPLYGGGNKGRRTVGIVDMIKRDPPHVVVTVGGVQSNHCRAVALACEQLGIKCHLIMHGELNATQNPTGNLRIAILTGATTQIVQPEEIAETIQAVKHRYQELSMKITFIPGGGETQAGVLTYAEAFRELLWQSEVVPEQVVVACGTGGTLAGMMIGAEQMNVGTELIGISVARDSEKSKASVSEAYRMATGKDADFSRVQIETDWIDGGYGTHSERTLSAAATIRQLEGLLVDNCYTGKATAGLLGLHERGRITSGRTVLWHTGGLYNFLS